VKHPPYHLRMNKAVDRLLLVDVLRHLGPEYGDFTYYSLAGPFLEDLRVMDHFFPDMKLISLESSEHTYSRQKLHQFNSRVDLRNCTLEDFLTHQYSQGLRDIFWLDYTDLKYSSLGIFKSILSQVPAGSVIKITLRAHPEMDLKSLSGKISKDEINRISETLLEEFKSEFSQALPSGKLESPKTFEDYAALVQTMIRLSASESCDSLGSQSKFLHIQSTRYNDGTQMLSVTGILCKIDEIEEVKTKLQKVRFADFNWGKPVEINIPILSMKERLHLERHLPIISSENMGEILHKELQYNIDNGRPKSIKQLSDYATYYRDYPDFVRISI
jgi:hypothetical protein